MMSAKTEVLAEVCERLLAGDMRSAADVASRGYPFVPIVPASRSYGEARCMVIFRRDGFTDRYSGEPLVFPGTLRLLSLLLPVQFPFQRNWRTTETHAMFWELFPTLDHVVPVCRGGADDDANLVTTSMLRNSAKANWLLEELGWELAPPRQMNNWDGLLGWFRRFLATDSSFLADTYVLRWHRAASR